MRSYADADFHAHLSGVCFLRSDGLDLAIPLIRVSLYVIIISVVRLASLASTAYTWTALFGVPGPTCMEALWVSVPALCFVEHATH